MRTTTSAHRIALLTVTLALVGGTLQAKGPLDKLNPFSWGSARSSDKPEPIPVPTASQKADLQISVGRSLESEGKLEQAIVIYTDALKNDGHCIEAYQRSAIVNDQLGNFEESDKLFRAALKREPKNAELLCDRGYSFYLQNRYAEAEKALHEALAINPRLARAHNNLALVLAQNERDEQALAEFAQGGCCEADSRVNLAFCMMARRDWAMARQELQRASAADPNSPAIKQGLAYLRAKAPPEVAQTAPTTPAPIMPVLKPAITEAPSAVVNVVPAATAAILTSYETPQSAADAKPCIPAPTPILSELTALSESMSFDPELQSPPAVVRLPAIGLKPAESAGANRPSPSARPTVESAMPVVAPLNAAVQSVRTPAPTANDDLVVASSQPKSEIRIVDHTERREAVKK